MDSVPTEEAMLHKRWQEVRLCNQKDILFPSEATKASLVIHHHRPCYQYGIKLNYIHQLLSSTKWI